MLLVILAVGAFFLIWAFLHRLKILGNSLRLSLLGSAVAWGTLITFSTEILSLAGIFNRAPLALFWLGVMAALITALQKKTSPVVLTKPSINKTDALFIGITVVMIIIIGLIALVAPPNNWDSMTYHMGRVAHWIQNRSVEFYPTGIPRQLWTSPWAEFAIAQLQILTLSDRLANMVQWASMVLSVIGVSVIAQLLGAGRRGQILSAVIAVTIPVGILEASSTQNDYVAAAWLVCLIAFALQLRKEARWPSVLFAALSLGLALLSKGTNLMFAAPFLAWMLIAGIRKYGTKILPAVLTILCIPLIVNAPQFTRYYEFNEKSLSLSAEAKNASNAEHSFQGLASNALRYIGLNLAVSNSPFNNIITNAVTRIHQGLNWNPADPRYTISEVYRVIFWIHEDNSCNTSTALAFLMAVIILIVRRIRDHGLYLYLLSLIAGFLIFCLMLKWQPWGNRLLLPLTVISAPFIGTVLDKVRSAWGILTAFALVIICIPWIFKNTSRAIMGQPYSIFTKDRQDQYFTNLPGMVFSYKRAVQEIKNSGCKDIGLVIGSDSWEYPLWPLLGAPRDSSIRIEHVNISNPSKKFAYPRGNFDPCILIADPNFFEQPKIMVNGATFVSTNRWSHLGLFRKDSDGRITAMVLKSNFQAMLDYSMKADTLTVQAQQTGQLTQNALAQIFQMRQEALRLAQQIDKEDLNNLFPGLGSAVDELFIRGHALFIQGVTQKDPASLNESQRLLNAWASWLSENLASLQNKIQ